MLATYGYVCAMLLLLAPRGRLFRANLRLRLGSSVGPVEMCALLRAEKILPETPAWPGPRVDAVQGGALLVRSEADEALALDEEVRLLIPDPR